MVSQMQAARGNTVYSNGSYAPTRGQVSAQGAQGYLKRELRKPGNVGLHGGVSSVGKDGQSDTRSGVTKSNLDWRQPKPNQDFKQPGGGKVRPDKNRNQDWQAPPRKPAGGSPAAPAPPASVIINSAGQIQLPYSAAWSSQLLSGLEESNAALTDLNRSRQDQAIQYMQGRRGLEDGYEDLTRTTLGVNASNGTAFSSMYGNAVSRNANDYNTSLNDMDAANTRFNTEADIDQNAIVASFNNQMRREALNYGDEQSESAGSLGYGKDKTKGPKRKPKPSKGGKSNGNRNQNWQPAGQQWVPAAGMRGKNKISPVGFGPSGGRPVKNDGFKAPSKARKK